MQAFFLLLLFKILKQPFFKGAECYVATADLYMEKKRLYFPSPIWVFLLCLHSWLRADWPESSEEGRADLGNFLLRLPMLLLSVLQFWHGRPSPLSGTARPLWFQLFEQLYSLLDCWISFFFFSRDTETFKRKYHRTRITLDRLITRNKLWFILKALATFFLINQSFKSG